MSRSQYEDDFENWDDEIEKDRVHVTCAVRQETERAVLVHDGTREIWIPKSQITEPKEIPPIGDTMEMLIPEWLAEEKGLI